MLRKLGLSLIVIGGVMTIGTKNVNAASFASGDSIVSMTTRNNYIHDSKYRYLVTKKNAIAYKAIGKAPDYTASVSINKNVPLTVRQTVEGGHIVTEPQSTDKLFLSNDKQFVYSSDVKSLSKKQIKVLAKDSKKWSSKIGKKSVQAVGYYTGDGYEKINGYLRNGKGQKKVVKKAQLVQKGISKFKLRYNTTVYRGISNKGLKLSLNNRGLSVGSIYQDKAFSSTSLSKQVALGFSSQCLLRINIPAGFHGAYIDPISKNKGEKEYLLKEGQKLIVTKIQNVSYTEATKMYLIKNKGSEVVQHTTNNVKGNYKLITLNLLN